MKRLIAMALLPLLVLVGCTGRNKIDDKKLIIGCSPSPHSEIAEFVKPIIEKEGYKVEIKVINDYVTPNLLLDQEDIDLNYFQHVPYLEDFNSKNNMSLTWITKVHFEPMGIYSAHYTEIGWSKLKNAKIAVPNDTSNNERAMDLLNEKFGDNLSKFKIVELEAQSLPSALADVDYAVINGNYALESKITNKCIVTEDSQSDIALKMANVIAVKEKAKNLPWINVVKKAFTSEELKKYITENYGSAVQAVF